MSYPTYNAVPDFTICAAKLHYPTASSAWEALRRFTKRQKHRGKKDERMSRRRAAQGTELGVYHCRCGQGWALGHPSAMRIAMGASTR